MKPTEALAMWRLIVVEFDFEIVYRHGKYHEAPDTMTRLPQKASKDENKNSVVDEDIPAYSTVGQINKPNHFFL